MPTITPVSPLNFKLSDQPELPVLQKTATLKQQLEQLQLLQQLNQQLHQRVLQQPQLKQQNQVWSCNEDRLVMMLLIP